MQNVMLLSERFYAEDRAGKKCTVDAYSAVARSTPADTAALPRRHPERSRRIHNRWRETEKLLIKVQCYAQGARENSRDNWQACGYRYWILRLRSG